MSQFELHVSTGGQKGTVIPLPPGKFMIGREEDCQLRPNSDLVSRHHCVFNVDEFGVRLRDLGSTNGTLVNGDRIRAVHVLKHGDVVAVGRLEFRVVVDGANVAEEDDTVASANDLDTMMEQVETIPSADRPTPPPSSLDTGETLTDMPIVGDETKIAAMGTPSPAETGFYYPGPQMPVPYGQAPYGYPGYPMPPMGGFYPGMGYPPQMYPQYPQQPYPGQPAPQQSQEPTSQANAGAQTQEVRLPDPSETGAKPPEPKPEPPKDAKGEVKKNIPETAAGIIKQYLQRRPTT